MPRQNLLTHSIKKNLYLARKKIEKKIEITARSLKSKSFDYNSYNLDYDSAQDLPYPTDWSRFYKYKKLYIEIGCGHGELISALSHAQPDDMFVGFEVTKKYSKLANSKLKDRPNAVVLKGDAYENSLRFFAPNSIHKINVLFPDPWHKKKHNKRRPLNTVWFSKIANNVVTGGEIFFATDWMDYYEFVLEQLKGLSETYEIATGEYSPEKFNYPPTHYYKKWLKIGREFKFIKMVKK